MYEVLLLVTNSSKVIIKKNLMNPISIESIIYSTDYFPCVPSCIKTAPFEIFTVHVEDLLESFPQGSVIFKLIDMLSNSI